MKVKFNPGKGLIRIPTLVSGPSFDVVVNLALDTGATSTVIGWEGLLNSGYDPAISQNRLRLTTASGIAYIPIVDVTQMEALGITRKNIHVACHSFPVTSTVEGVLGLDFFKDVRLLIDFKAGYLETSF